jgi:hypothetical protein
MHGVWAGKKTFTLRKVRVTGLVPTIVCCAAAEQREALCWSQGQPEKKGRLQGNPVFLGGFLQLLQCRAKVPSLNELLEFLVGF